jgi:adenylate dimethylallyltransferase (cytokinin synthase)
MVVIVGATGTEKTKKSIDAAEAVGGKVVNMDKIQLYTGMDVTTNKVGFEDHHGVAHHQNYSRRSNQVHIRTSLENCHL